MRGKHRPYSVTIKTRAGTVIKLNNPPASLQELLEFTQGMELAELKALTNGSVPSSRELVAVKSVDVSVPVEMPIRGGQPSQEEEEDEVLPNVCRSRFTSPF